MREFTKKECDLATIILNLMLAETKIVTGRIEALLKMFEAEGCEVDTVTREELEAVITELLTMRVEGKPYPVPTNFDVWKEKLTPEKAGEMNYAAGMGVCGECPVDNCSASRDGECDADCVDAFVRWANEAVLHGIF